MANLLSEESLAWCWIGTGMDFRKQELGFEPLTPNPSWTIHPGGVFAPEFELCASSLRGYRIAKGKHFAYLSCLFLLANLVSNYVQDPWHMLVLGGSGETLGG